MSNHTLRVLQIVPGTSVDGPGLRTSIYLAGCRHHCPECHNPQSWDFHGGTLMTVDEIMAQVRAHDFNVTLTGGDPLQHESFDALTELIDAISAEDYTIWCYTGYTFEEIIKIPSLRALLPKFQAIVEGPFISRLRTTELPFRGSSNQRILRPDGSEWK